MLRWFMLTFSFLVVLQFTLGSGCARTATDKAITNTTKDEFDRVENVRRAFQGKFDPESLRFLDDQLVIDLVLSNTSSFDLQDVDIAISLTDQNPKLWKKRVEVIHWKQGDQRRLVVPVSDSANPSYVIEGHLSFKSGQSSQPQKVSVAQERTDAKQPVGVARPTIFHGGGPDSKGADDGLTVTAEWLNDNNKTAFLTLVNSGAKYPKMRDVKLRIVGSDNKVELFNFFHSVKLWEKWEKVSIPIPQAKFPQLKIRGVGTRYAANAEDTAQAQQVFFITLDCQFDWKK